MRQNNRARMRSRLPGSASSGRTSSIFGTDFGKRLHGQVRSVAAAIGLATVLTACAAQQPAPPPPAPPAPVVWQLSPGADTIYNYLRFEELSRTRGAEGDPTQAMRQVLGTEPSPELYLELANYYWRQGRLPQARDVIKEGVTKFPDDKPLYLNLANSYLIEKRYDAAVLTLREYLEKHTDDMSLRQDIAAVLLEERKYAEALDTLKAVPEEQRTTAMLFYTAKAEYGLGQTRAAIEHLNKAVTDDPGFLDAWAELAFLYEIEKDYAKAEKVYTRILEMGESGQEVWLRLIRLNLKLNNPDKAMRLVNEAPVTPIFLFQVATTFLRDGFYAQAEQILLKIQNAPEVADDISFQLAILQYEHHRNPDKALEYLGKIPDTWPRYNQALGFKGQILLQLKRLDEALSVAVDGQKRFPGETDFWLIEAGVYEERGDFTTASAVIDKALAAFPKNTDLLYHRGVIEDKRGDRAASFKTMEEILDLDAEHADAMNYVGYTLAEEGRELPRAVELIQHALRLKPGSGYIIDSLAWAYYRSGKFDQAWTEIQKAVLKIEDDPTIWEHYGDIAKALKKRAEARKAYRKSLDAGHKEPDKIKEKLKGL